MLTVQPLLGNCPLGINSTNNISEATVTGRPALEAGSIGPMNQRTISAVCQLL